MHTTTTVPAALLAAVLAEPDSDFPRLVYAEWLEEHGEPERAGLLRRMLACPEMRTSLVLWTKAAGRGEYWGRDAGPVKDMRGAYRMLAQGLPDAGLWSDEAGNYPHIYFRRGFAERIRCCAADFLTHADALCWHPEQGRPCPPSAQPIQEVTLTTWPEVEWRGPFPDREVRLPGRPWRHWKAVQPIEGGETWKQLLLAAEWPRISFALPPAGLTPHGTYVFGQHYGVLPAQLPPDP